MILEARLCNKNAFYVRVSAFVLLRQPHYRMNDLLFQKMKTAASPLSWEQLLASPTSASPSTRKAIQLLLLLLQTVMEKSTAPRATFQVHHRAGKARRLGAGGLTWSCWAVVLCWQLLDWAATF